MLNVEIFKTNVTCSETARQLVNELQTIFPKSEINFDLEDCDRILRVQSKEINPPLIIDILLQKGFLCEVL